MSGRLIGWGLHAIALLSVVVPLRLLYAFARWLGWLAMPIFEGRRQTVRNNLQRLHPNWEPDVLDVAARRVFEENAMYYVDAALLPHLPPQQVLDDHLAIQDLDLLKTAVGRGKGVVLAGAHLSNPELPFRALAALGIDGLALVEPLADGKRMEEMRRRRETGGLRFVPADMHGVKQALEQLRGGGVVAVLIDRDIQKQGVCVPFMRRLAQFPTGAIDLAMRTESTLLFSYAVRLEDPRHQQRFAVRFLETPELLRSDNRANDVRANIANLVALMEPILQEHCTQWRMFESPWAACRDTVYHEGGAPRPLSGTP